ncbi:hypothetical protein F506_01250 [Herbaspirillum hiltneri N3]|uniref:Sugar O-methyltransferase n=1 Tax=Herbaspirillum hiltneri N3 TaxID=1262470 RepID=A0ABM5UWG0_9BURK|nr:putative sugar O-methyltransferase [Herbaspirillum hiltneri]AKZ61478.1 hypothetical protein F506_01250 [Herbaspirillum hiltneri N3]
MIFSDQISRTLDGFHAYIARNLAACAQHPAARVSAFWGEHFADRSNFPDVRDFLSFRRGNFLYGIGDTGPATSEQKQREFEDISKSMLLFTPVEFIERLREPVLGAPLVYACGNAILSSSYVLNAGTAWRVSQLVAQYGRAPGPLRICEIGAGWGACASQLHQVCDVASYTIVDLPENLCLSSTYLATTLPERRAGFVECIADGTAAPETGSLNFALPPAIDRLSGPYDLIINTMSFQEMDRETVDEYFRWAARTLAPGGLLLSFNAHDKAGILRPSDYLHDGLELAHVAPFRKVPASYFNTIPYETVFIRKEGAVKTSTAVAIDALGELIQLGLDTDITEMTTAGLAAEHGRLLLMREFLYAADETQRQAVLTQLLQEEDVITNFLAGNYWYAQGHMDVARHHLARSLSAGLQDFAATRARVLLASLDRNVDASAEKILVEIGAAAGGLRSEIAAILATGDVSRLQNHIARVLDCPVITPAESGATLRRVWRRLVGANADISTKATQ